MPKPACVPCQRFMRPVRTGAIVLEQKPKSHDALPGSEHPEQWEPYKLWRADKYRCEGCGHETIAGWAKEHFAEHYEPHFADHMIAAEVTVNDC